MERMVQQEKRINPEQFLDERIQVLPVSKEEFVDLVKLKYPEMSVEDITQTKGINFDQDGQIIVLLRTDIFPEEYMPYLETHEKWEAYIARKSGYNLFDKSVREYKRDKGISDFDERCKQEFFDEIGTYNYDFRHEFAVYKEYKQAMRDGKLEEYHKWMGDLRDKERLTVGPTVLKLIENDTKIRESIYKKLKEGTRHVFLRNK